MARLKGNWMRLSDGVSASPYFKEVTSPRLAVQFLQTCRQIYSEAHDLLYTSNTFAFHEGWTLDLFMTKCLSPSQRQKISSIELDDWGGELHDPRSSGSAKKAQCLSHLRSIRVAVTNAHPHWNMADAIRRMLQICVPSTCGQYLPLYQQQSGVKVTVDQAIDGAFNARELEDQIQFDVELRFGFRPRPKPCWWPPQGY